MYILYIRKYVCKSTHPYAQLYMYTLTQESTTITIGISLILDIHLVFSFTLFLNTCPIRIALTWTPEGRRKRGRPKETWRRTVERERGELGFKGWAEAGSCAKDREAWRERTQGPISLRGKRTWWWWWWWWRIFVREWIFFVTTLWLPQAFWQVTLNRLTYWLLHCTSRQAFLWLAVHVEEECES